MMSIICTGCPKGCHMSVDMTNGARVTGHGCPRGEAYGIAEATNPTRVLTSTVRIDGADISRMPVRSRAPIPKQSMLDVMRALNSVKLASPVSIGDTVLKDAAGTGVDIVATRAL